MKYKSKRIINILLLVCILVTNFIGTVYATKHIFSDSIGHWAEETINILTERGIIQGYPDGLSHPDDIITRGEFSALLARTMKFETKDREDVEPVFEDIIGHFAQKEIEALVDEDIILVEDYGKLYFPNKPISRMEIIKMLVRATGKENHDPDCYCDTGFIDEKNLTKEEVEYICIGKHYNIISGYPDRTIRPNGESTRAEAFTMLIKQEKAKEKIEKDKAKDKNEEEKPTVPSKPTNPTDKKPDKDTENNSSTGNGSNYVPAPKYSFELPLTAYVDEEIKIITKASNVKSVTWEISKDGIPVDLLSVIDGELEADGGTIKIKSIGNYTFTATAVNSRGKETKYEQTIDIYPVASANFKLPETAHTDTTIDVDLSTQNLGDSPVSWLLKKDNVEIELDTNITGELTNSGGLIIFNNTGIYELTAVITDELGKQIKVSNVIRIYPVGEIELELDEITHTDRKIILKTETKNLDDMELTWSLTRNGEEVDISEFIEGTIALEDSTIGFKEKGVYNLILSAMDKTGRTFTDKVSITVYPVGSAGFYLPEIFHTDDEIKIEVAFEETGNRDAEWSLIKDGEIVELSNFINGKLSNEGGTVAFPHKGEYILKASFTDNGGRVYDYEQKFKVYPVPNVSYIVPKYAHTDSDIRVDVDSVEIDNLEIEWLVDNTFGFQDWSTYVEGNLNNLGGSIRFKRAGVYELVARITDETGRVFLFETGDKVEVLPVLDIGFELPRLAYTDSIINIRTYGNNNVLPVEWSIIKDGKVISENHAISGSLNAQGGKITFLADGNYILKATMTDFLERNFSYSQEITIKPVIEYSFSMPNSIHYGKEFEVKVDSKNLGTNKVKWTLEKTGEVVEYHGELTNEGGKISISDTGEITLIATIIDGEGRMFTHKEKITITNTAPTVTLTASPTRTVKNGKFFVDIKATASDPDGDSTTLEYEGTTSDNYYPVGTHTIRVRAKDDAGAYSPWVEESFTIKNSAPTTPVITRTPNGNSVAPGTKVTITAKSTDADNDPITYVWEGRNAKTQVYPLGKNTVRVKAVDSTGAESPWAAIVFFVADSNGSGGMTLTGSDSVILENGLEGATISEYTFTVPPVAGHSGSDYGRVRGYNVLTKEWDQLDYGTTSNGITFSRTLSNGVYSKLEFYYYTNHNCMYNKSNITYSVSYHFE
ncbi:S-layer homology domain-containing protein [Schnuerera sp. xch1]|uniref:S-layer homology domain-containing protein n=1 Tax=Schnuerera sp. xch1 TaxID=2874283 RepID=UPI001CBC7167|nr:S-layer homology domain-containing protein [Schnuerera sp. xch1]MBZ2175621.1 S-layer homology domain-containing protein [Schnuerera sp. xch1]